MGDVIRHVFKIDTFTLTECADGYYLYDKVIGMNISMRAKTEQDAYIEALLYYQKTLATAKAHYRELDSIVENFISQIRGESEDEK
jgi:hypothetical protein